MQIIKIGNTWRQDYAIHNDDKTKQAVFDTLIKWMEDKSHYASSHGECIMQDDNCRIDAVELIAEIIDEILQPTEINE